MIRIFLLNGPPGSGKDTAAEFLVKEAGGELIKFAEPIKAAAAAIYCSGDRQLFNLYDKPTMKDLPQDMFFGKSCRDVQIAISERFMKKFHGTWIFGKILRNAIVRKHAAGQNVFFVSDSGFKPEALELMKEFGHSSLKLLRIHRPGYDFSKDSRSYIDLGEEQVQQFDVQNDSIELVFQQRMKEIVSNLIGEST